jgi:hypothetical protein
MIKRSTIKGTKTFMTFVMSFIGVKETVQFWIAGAEGKTLYASLRTILVCLKERPSPT